MRRSRRGVTAQDSDSDPDPDFLDRILPPRFRRRERERAGGHFGEEEGAGQGRMRWRQGRGSGRRSDDLLGKAKPEMFDAWIEKRRGALEKWEAADSVVSKTSSKFF
jgi:hypothetical protein